MNRPLIFKTLMAVGIIMNLAPSARSELSLGVGYPYVAVRFTPDFFDWVGIEAKYAFGENLAVLGGRGYINFFKESRVKLYTGYEIAHIQYQDSELSASGKEYGLFGGFQVIISPSINLSLDISPTMINLDSQSSSVSGIEWIINTAIYLNLF